MHTDLYGFMQTGLAFVVVNINISYRRPALMNEILTVDTSVRDVGNRSAVIRQVIRLQGSDTVVAEADVTFVLFDSKQNRAVTIEGEIRALMDRLAAED